MKKLDSRTEAVLVIVAGIALMVFMLLASGCKTCEPEIVYQPVEVQVPVPIQPQPLQVAPVPQYENCSTGSDLEKVRCIGRNVEKLRDWAQRLLDELRAHNASVETGDPVN